jgi:lipopolysaccharide transport system ATP-binding protein
MSQIAVEAQNVSKQYKIGVITRRHDTLRDQLTEGMRRFFRPNGKRQSEEAFWALKDVNFEVRAGEVVGIVGRNGAGKSTLLKILSRITEPTTGRVKIYGKIGSLLEVGTGFHPELTGRENVYLNGAILGMKKTEIHRKFDEIVAFSEIERFIDTPVKRYSSGMYVRLAFAVAAHLEPEVLIVDEVLAVGDTVFQKKCLGKMEGVAQEGRTVLFVSHNMAAVEHLCSRVLILQNGELVYTARPKEAIDYYLRSVTTAEADASSHVIDLTRASGRSRHLRPILKRMELFSGGNPMNGCLKIGANLRARILFEVHEPTTNFHFALGFDNSMGQRLFTASTDFQPDELKKTELIGEQMIVCDIPSLQFAPGEYRIKALFTSSKAVDRVENVARFTVVESDYYGSGKIPSNDGMFVLKHQWYLANGESKAGIAQRQQGPSAVS